ncbi:MAG: Uma2 family endonuclease, partial [Pyrinomonadaceae bacterium]
VENRAIVSVQDPIEIDDFNEPEPDIALLKPRGDFYSMNHPTVKDILLLVEVSDSPIEYDRDIKIGIYAEAGIAEIWLVDLNEETIEQYLFPENGRYGSIETFRRGDSIQSDSLAELSLEVSAVLGLIKNG